MNFSFLVGPGREPGTRAESGPEQALKTIEDQITEKEYELSGLKSLDIPRSVYLARDVALRKELAILRETRTHLREEVAKDSGMQ